MISSIFAKGIRDQRRSLLAWVVGIAAYVALLCAVYPAVQKSAGSLNQYLQNLPSAFRNAFLGGSVDFSSPAGFIDTELFSFMGPILILVFAVGFGARAVAGEEEAGTLDMVLAYPVGSVAFVAAAASGRRVVGISAGGGLAWVFYLMNALGQLVHSIDGVRVASPFYYYGGAAPLVRGLDAANVTVFLVATLVALGAALVAFKRRDLQS